MDTLQSHVSEPRPFLATLVRGSLYDLRGVLFERDIPVPITQHQHDYLVGVTVRQLSPGFDPQYDPESDRVIVVPLFEITENPDPWLEHATEFTLRDRDAAARVARFRSFDAKERARLDRLAPEAEAELHPGAKSTKREASNV